MARKTLPQTGRPWPELSQHMAELAADDVDWRHGRSPAYVFKASDATSDVVRNAYFQFFDENALATRKAFHGLQRMEQEVLEMGLELFHAPVDAVGTMTTGGTESIFLAIKTCRDWTRANRPLPGRPNLVIPLSAHPAFEKAADLMDMEVRRVDLASDYRADPYAMARAIDANTLMLVGSAPCFPHGVIDPIGELSDLARERQVWLHVDACVGGYVAPFAREAGYPIPDFDFVHEAVCSLSADLHKFGYAAKPASTVFYRSPDLHQHQRFHYPGWSSGAYLTETFVGTRPGGAIAAAWAVLNHHGREGYTALAHQLMRMTHAYRGGIEAIDGLRIVGDPHLSLISYTSDEVDMRGVAEQMTKRGWLVNLTRVPVAIHLMLSMIHEPAREQYLTDLQAAVAAARQGIAQPAGIAATY